MSTESLFKERKLESQSMWLNDRHFLRIHEGKIILWDFQNHSQFEVSPGDVERMLSYSKGRSLGDSTEDENLLESGMLLSSPPREPWGWDWLAEIYHVGTSHPLAPTWGVDDQQHALEYAKSYLEFCEQIAETKPEFEIVHGGEVVPLPPPDLSAVNAASLWRTLASRQTCRDFDGTSVSIQQLANLLYVVFGKLDREDEMEPLGIQRYGYRRTSPSAGGLQCVEPYIWASNVSGLAPGIYHYLAMRNQLEIVRPELPSDKLSTYLCNQHWANDAPFAVFLTCRMDKMWWKYPHSRAYRPMLMEVGHFSQTFMLTATALELHPWITGYFHDKEINELLDLPVPSEQVLLLLAAGNGSGSGYTKEDRELLPNWKPSIKK